MSESMLERVARAIHKSRQERGFSGAAAWEYEPDQIHDLFRHSARSAIEAMREPTDAMKQDGWHELRKHNDIQTRLGNSLVGVETPTYQAMIDAASQGR